MQEKSVIDTSILLQNLA